MIHFTRFRFAFRLFQLHFVSSGLLSLFFLKSLFRTNATTPPLDVAPAAVSATLATHAGHICYAAPFSRGRLLVFSKYSARRSSDPSQNLRYSSTHCAACFSGLASSCIS